MGKDGDYDLEERTYRFAKSVRVFIKRLKPTLSNLEDSKQLVRSSGSVGANYIEANGALGGKDFAMKIKICRKEAKESRFFLRLLDLEDREELGDEHGKLIREAMELTWIFGAILRKSK